MFLSRHSRLQVDKNGDRSEAHRAGKGSFGAVLALTIGSGHSTTSSGVAPGEGHLGDDLLVAVRLGSGLVGSRPAAGKKGSIHVSWNV
eukprot:630228-Alexandrium_andersonii.AAC.4